MIRLLGAFFKLIRWPNLFFIAVTQFLFYYCILLPCYRTGELFSLAHQLQEHTFWLLSLSSVLIAAAGYIINDYFDLSI
ncbi:MAG: ubiquinone biosynthesis protein UbiA, partial [Bacteroidota bacterium]|nr:ubiquinone biosynthesis protein UbiA [Bacteroidota bacterium]